MRNARYFSTWARLIAACALLAACGGESGSDTTGSGGGGGSGGGAAPIPTCAGDPDPALACDAPALCDYPVEIVGSTGAPPAMSGGAVADGTYLLTSYTKYGAPKSGPLGTSVQMVVVIAGPDIRGSVSLAGSMPNAYAGTLDTSGGKFKVDNTCPSMSPDSSPDEYTATADAIHLLSNGDELLVYTRTK